MVRCALLDVDGTLLDSNDAHARIWVRAFEKYGFDVDYALIRGCIGMGGDRIMRRFADLDDSRGLGHQIATERKAMFLEELPRLRPFPNVRDLLERMRDAGLRRVVATSAAGEELIPLLEQAGILELVDRATSSADADRSKPAPDIISAAIARSEVRPQECVMLGDTPYDFEAAGRAGVPAVLLRCGGWPFDGREGALAVYDDPTELLARFDESPFAVR
jgi:HAD superfamily hydrolase (TIGR01509 family)